MTSQTKTRLNPGDVFSGRYHIEDLLGRGNFSAVYRAKQTIFDINLRSVALKVFCEGAVKPENARLVFNDAIALLGLMDEAPEPSVARHLINILDGGICADQSGQAFLAMELVRGRPLDRIIQPHYGLPHIGGVRLELTLFYLQQILIPLAWMHSLDPPAVHGDLHFGNVLVEEKTNLVRLADFGHAARLPAPVFGGAIRCQAPETLLDNVGDTQSDVYALGLLWYEMLTGKRAFSNDRLETISLELQSLNSEVSSLSSQGHEKESKHKERECTKKRGEYIHEMIKARKGALTPASEVNRQLSDYRGLEDILNRCLAFKSSQRYYDAAQLKNAVEDYLSGDMQRVLFTPPPAPSIPEPVLPGLTFEVILDNAMRLARGGRFHEALGEADKAIKINSYSAMGWLVKARINLIAAKGLEGDEHQKLIGGAYPYVNKARGLAPEEAEVFDVLAEVFEADGKPDTADSMKSIAASLRKKKSHGSIK